MSEIYNNCMQLGENGSMEYSWNMKDTKELITQYQFQLTLSSKQNIEKLESKIIDFLCFFELDDFNELLFKES